MVTKTQLIDQVVELDRLSDELSEKLEQTEGALARAYAKFPKSKREAVRLGEKSYFTGVRCKYGHLDLRRAVDGYCRECSRIRYDEWAADNPCKARLNNLRQDHRRKEQRFIERCAATTHCDNCAN